MTDDTTGALRREFDTETERLSYELAQANRRITECSERIDQLEYTISQLVTDLPTQTLSKHDKLGRILKRAFDDAAPDDTHAYVNQDLAAGAADCTKRHARNLFQELGDTYPWATYNPDREPAGLELDFDTTTTADARDSLTDQFPVLEENDA